MKSNYSHSHPLVSIVTVVFNGRAHLQETIDSVRRQTYPNIEYIVVDGGSTDGTVDILQENDETLDYWRSEPDKGIYNAMNKGISMATGEIIGLVNADDAIYPDALVNVVEALNSVPDAGFACAPVDLATEDGSIFGRIRTLSDAEVHTQMYRVMAFPHPGMYVRRQVYERLGGYDESYKISADYEFLLRLLENYVPYVRIKTSTGYFRTGGASGRLKVFIEMRRVLQKHGLPKWFVEYRFYFSLVKFAFRKGLPEIVFKFLQRFRKHSSIEFN